MRFETFDIAGPLLITPKRFSDSRGYFSELYRVDTFQAHVSGVSFVQDNQSFSAHKGTLRGLHYQKAPRVQAKLVRVVQGSIFDVAVDVRPGSPTFGRHVSVTLTDEDDAQFYVPGGFLHGFCTLTDKTIVTYKVSDFYSAAHDAAVRWDDPDIAVQWPMAAEDLHLSDKDRAAPLLAQAQFGSSE
jgi:dTDP-4-dehydrorhamnose 3,5-epimerase